MGESKNKGNWHNLEFFTPITEFSANNEDLIIKGIAISETTTHNNHKYIAEELQKAAPTLVGRPLLVDHDNRIESIKGKVTDALFDHTNKHIKFEAKVMDQKIKEMIKDGRISNVSIGAYAEDLVKEESGAIIAKGIKIAELSLVAVPADENASFGMALASNYAIKEAMDAEDQKDKGADEDLECPDCGKKFKTKADMKKHMKTHEMFTTGKDSETKTERRYGEMTEEISQEITQLKEKVALYESEKRQNLINEYKKLCSDKNVKEKDVSKFSNETIQVLSEQLKDIIIPEKTEMKSLVSQEVSNDLSNVVYENIDGKSGIWLMPDNKLRAPKTRW